MEGPEKETSEITSDFITRIEKERTPSSSAEQAGSYYAPKSYADEIYQLPHNEVPLFHIAGDEEEEEKEQKKRTKKKKEEEEYDSKEKILERQQQEYQYYQQQQQLQQQYYYQQQQLQQQYAHLYSSSPTSPSSSLYPNPNSTPLSSSSSQIYNNNNNHNNQYNNNNTSSPHFQFNNHLAGSGVSSISPSSPPPHYDYYQYPTSSSPSSSPQYPYPYPYPTSPPHSSSFVAPPHHMMNTTTPPSSSSLYPTYPHPSSSSSLSSSHTIPYANPTPVELKENQQEFPPEAFVAKANSKTKKKKMKKSKEVKKMKKKTGKSAPELYRHNASAISSPEYAYSPNISSPAHPHHRPQHHSMSHFAHGEVESSSHMKNHKQSFVENPESKGVDGMSYYDEYGDLTVLSEEARKEQIHMMRQAEKNARREAKGLKPKHVGETRAERKHRLKQKRKRRAELAAAGVAAAGIGVAILACSIQ